jgi:hypothetical protein
VGPTICPEDSEYEDTHDSEHHRRRLGGGPITGTVVDLIPLVGASLFIALLYPQIILYHSCIMKRGLDHSLPNIEKNS